MCSPRMLDAIAAFGPPLVHAHAALAAAVARAEAAEAMLRDVVRDAIDASDCVTICRHCKAAPGEGDPHRGDCVAERARMLLGLPVPT